eukprot:5462471-Amphidinium_carterae.1
MLTLHRPAAKIVEPSPLFKKIDVLGMTEWITLNLSPNPTASGNGVSGPSSAFKEMPRQEAHITASGVSHAHEGIDSQGLRG